MGEIRTPKSDVVATACAAGDSGATEALSNLLIDVGDGSGPLAVWLTGIYGIATVNGTAHLFESMDGAAFVAYVAGNARHMLSIYLTTTGDGIIFENGGIGPITQDLWLASDATFTCNAGEVVVTYDEVGQQ